MRTLKHNLPSDPLDFLDEIFCDTKTVYLIEVRSEDFENYDCEKIFDYCVDFLKLKSMNHGVSKFKTLDTGQSTRKLFKASFVAQNKLIKVTCVLTEIEDKEVYRLTFEKDGQSSYGVAA